MNHQIPTASSNAEGDLLASQTTFSFQGATIARHMAFLSSLVQRGGPCADDYARLDTLIEDFYNQFKESDSRGGCWEALREVLSPILIPETMQGWAYLKPHGYAGDFEIIDRHYLQYVAPNPRLQAWDRWWHSGAAAKAVRNRKSYFHQLLDDHAHKVGGNHLSVLNIASGPGRDVFEYLCQGRKNVRFECLDQDPKAISHAVALCREHSAQVSFTTANILKYRPNKPHDLIWSAGLFDYFSDRTFKLLLRRLIPCIAPGGQLVIGNFCDSNPNRLWLQFFDWHLHHRSSEQLLQLAVDAGARYENVSVGNEPEGVNLFLHIYQPENAISAV